MVELYYSQRQTRTRQSPQSQLGRNLWVAFMTYLDRLSDQNYFCEKFAGSCSDGYPMGRSDEAVASWMRQEFGVVQWPVARHDLPNTEQILDFIEFFFRHVAKPTKSWDHDYCGHSHPTDYDGPKGRYEYTVEINAMLERFNHPYKLQKGSIVRKGSETLDARIAAVELRTTDTHLLRLLGSALESFYDKSGAKKLEGLQSLVDAFERIKTLEGQDKKTSVRKVIGRLSPIDEIRQQFDEHLRKMTDLAIRYTIRHHESDKIILDDVAIIEYLFYSYYNLIRLILEKYEIVE